MALRKSNATKRLMRKLKDATFSTSDDKPAKPEKDCSTD